MNELRGAHIHITGVVQGVGFRPFVYGLATRLSLAGWVRNTSAGVDIEVDGSPESLAAFVESLRLHAPPLARIDDVRVTERDPNGFSTFEIAHSEPIPNAFQPVAPDVGICPDCLRELFDPADRRYGYPFINCTNCGPRFTIIKDVPYDRPLTTMATFGMCADCAAEYANPLNRRFHAQPVACPKCGPQVRLETKGNTDEHGLTRMDSIRVHPRSSASSNPVYGDEAIFEASRLLAQGKIIAVKGLGGFHLACDATNEAAVAELRRRKGRVDKPFALMMPDLATVERYCELGDEERALLQSPQRPIVLLNRRTDRPAERPVSPLVAPGQSTLGVMLPYTPLHYLLFDAGRETKAEFSSSFILHPSAFVMTSGNFSEEPIAADNDDALTRLAPLADAFLLHDRDIHVRCDDSVVRVFEGRELPIRRSRGYAPYPIRLPCDAPPALATGAELKNTFCVTRGDYAFLSHHVGDMENYETLRSFEDGVAHFERLFRIKPELIAYDLHPNYLATRYALERAGRENLRAIGVQHHHAHAAACMAENGLRGDRPVIGVVFDGTGYGTDGAIWGGEFLVADYGGFERAAHLAYVPLPGGDAATRNPYRIGLSYLHQAGIEWTDDLAPVRAVIAHQSSAADALSAIRHQLQTGLNAPPTSSMGRLFDAVASIAGVRQSVNYEGQAAIELEALAGGLATGDVSPRDAPGGPGHTLGYAEVARQAPAFRWKAGHGQAERGWKLAIGRLENGTYLIDTTPVIRAVVDAVRAGVPVPVISAQFHQAVAAMLCDVCVLIREARGLSEVALSGGVFQNVTLLKRALDLLRAAGFTVFTHRGVPPNDGGLALGQAVIAAHSI